MPRVLIVRGHQATPWELAPWRELPARFEVSFLLTRSNRFTAPEGLQAVRVRALRDLLPGGVAGELGALALGDRYLGAEEAFAAADIVHAEELSYWFAAQAAKRKARHGFRLVQTVWETLPLLDAYRNAHARRHRELVLGATDLFLPATERAAQALRLEGVPQERIRVCAPGIDLARFAAVPAGDPAPVTPVHAPIEQDPAPAGHTILSPGRLVWEKGHHDVLRALAALHRGLVAGPDGGPFAGADGAGLGAPGGRLLRPRLLIVGAGPEEQRLRAHAAELGLADAVEVRAEVPYAEMPALYARASALVLASLSSAGSALHPFDIPRAFWEEQFGMVLAEAMAAGLPILASNSGAIPEVLAGAPAQLFAPGDWMGIARALAAGPLAHAPGTRTAYPAELVQRYSTTAAAQRLAAAYDLLSTR